MQANNSNTSKTDLWNQGAGIKAAENETEQHKIVVKIKEIVRKQIHPYTLI